jgi:sugar phosphate isomerase/epimerase
MWKNSVVVAPAAAVNAPAPLKGSTAETIKNAAAIGYDAVQFSIKNPNEFDLAEALEALETYKIKASSIATGMGYTVDGLSLGHKDEDNRKAAVERMRQHIDLAVQLGGADVGIGTIRGSYSNCDSKEEYMKQYKKSLAEVIEYAEKKRIRIVHEAIGRTDCEVLGSIDDNLELIKSFNSPYFRLQIDSHHMNLEETDFYSAILKAGDWVAQADISDLERKCPDGKHFDFQKMLKALSEIGYKDYLIFEFKAVGDGVAEATEGLNYIKGLCESMGIK